MRMYSIQNERQNADLVVRLSDDPKRRDFGETFGSIGQQFVLVSGYGVDSYLLDVIDGRSQSDHTGDIGCSGLEFPRQIGPCPKRMAGPECSPP